MGKMAAVILLIIHLIKSLPNITDVNLNELDMIIRINESKILMKHFI